MEIYVRDENLKRVSIISQFSSLTWLTKYRHVGNFTIECSMKYFNLFKTKGEKFIENTADPWNLAYVESVEKSTTDAGDKVLKIKGKMALGWLKNRVILADTYFEQKDIGYIAESLMKSNVTEPSDPSRSIPIIRWAEVGEWGKQDLRLSRGSTLLQALYDLSKPQDLGLVMEFCDDEKLNLKIYQGVNRTTNQTEALPVTLEQTRGTAGQIEYYLDNSTLATWVAIDKENKVPTEYGSGSGLNRKEVFLDYSSVNQTITQSDGSEVKIADQYYQNMIINKAQAELEKMVETQYLDVQTTQLLAMRFRDSLYLGDFVTVVDTDTGFTQDQQVTAATEIWDSRGYTLSLQVGKSSIDMSEEV